MRVQTLVGVGVLLTGLGLAFGAITIPSEAGYGGVGPNFLPWVCAIVLTLCGGWIIWEARSGGFREMEAPEEGADPAYWSGFVWLAAGLLLNASLITVIGFILSCTLCYVLAVQGLPDGSQPAEDLDQRPGHGLPHRCAGVLDVHQVPRHQPAGTHVHRLALNVSPSWKSSTP